MVIHLVITGRLQMASFEESSSKIFIHIVRCLMVDATYPRFPSKSSYQMLGQYISSYKNHVNSFWHVYLQKLLFILSLSTAVTTVSRTIKQCTAIEFLLAFNVYSPLLRREGSVPSLRMEAKMAPSKTISE
jgi:hypothetical protein